METAVTVFIAVVGLIVVGGVVTAVVLGLRQWSRNNASPVLQVPATVVAKRTHVSGGMNDSGATTSYYLTFELPGGERRELHVGHRDYGQVAERDHGQLTYQGTRFQGFVRAV